MKNLDLDRSWKLCKQMWKWISEEYTGLYNSEEEVAILKDQWLQDHNIRNVELDCFFCDWAKKTKAEFTTYGNYCNLCPGKLVDPKFSCVNPKYHYVDKPKAFYQKILHLDKIR